MAKKKYDRDRKRRSDQRVIDVGVGRKKVKDAVVEEVVEETFDWLERGGFKRLWMVFKVVLVALIALIILVVLLVLNQ